MICQDTYSESEMHWFAICTAPRHEKRVNELISGRNIETFLPLYRTERHWKKRPPVTLELPLFPSYVFVRVPYPSRGRVLSTPGVLSFVGNGRQAIAISDSEIKALRDGISQYPAEPHAYFAVGEKVRIKAGPLAGFTGTLVRHKTGTRVVLMINAIMQGVAVEIDLADLQPADSPAHLIAPSNKNLIM
jgi:transcription antitermination factor NusG